MTGMESRKSWQASFAEMVGKAIDRARGDFSDQWISDQASRLGHPISRTAVSEYRRGKRKTIPVTDLIVLARALDVPPVSLLFPDLPNGLIPAMPYGKTEGETFPTESEVPAFDALRWFTGESPILPTGRDYVFDFEKGRLIRSYVSFDYRHAISPNDTRNIVESPAFELLEACRGLADACSRFTSLTHDFINLPREESETRLRLMDTAMKEIERAEKRVRDLGGNLDHYEETESSDGDD